MVFVVCIKVLIDDSFCTRLLMQSLQIHALLMDLSDFVGKNHVISNFRCIKPFVNNIFQVHPFKNQIRILPYLCFVVLLINSSNNLPKLVLFVLVVINGQMKKPYPNYCSCLDIKVTLLPFLDLYLFYETKRPKRSYECLNMDDVLTLAYVDR